MTTAASPLPFSMDLELIEDKIDTHQPVPTMGAPDAITLGYALVAACDAKASPSTRRENGRVARATEQLEVARTQAEAPEPEDEAVDPLARAQVSATVLADSLEGHARLFWHSEEVALARQVRATLFPQGRPPGRRTRRQTWLHIKELRSRMPAGSEIAANLDYLVGSWVLQSLAHWHDEAGRVLGFTAAAPTTPGSTVRLGEALRVHRERVAAYVRVVLGEVDDQDPASIARAERMIEPLVRLREELAARRANNVAAEPVEKEPGEEPSGEEPSGAEGEEPSGGSAPTKAVPPGTEPPASVPPSPATGTNTRDK